MRNKEFPAVNIRQVERSDAGYARDELSRIAVTYAKVFAGSPWNEVSKCDEGFSSQPVGSECDSCGTSRMEAYPLSEQTQAIENELNRPDAACFVMEDVARNELVGFSWGFRYDNVEEFVAEKYSGEGLRYDRLRRDVTEALGGFAINSTPFYYLSETGIIDDVQYRGRGYSKQFVRLRTEIANDLGLDIVQRTSSESPMYRTMQGAGFEEVFGNNVGIPDAINPQRVLFLKKTQGRVA